MYKNRRIFLFVATLVVLLIGISCISATEISDDNVTSTSDDYSADNYVSAIESQINTTKKIDTESVVEDKDIKTDEADNTVITVTNSNYNRYFDTEGYTTNNVNDNNIIKLTGNFTNKTFCLDKTNITLTGENAYLVGGYIYISDESVNATVSNITINTTGYEYAIMVDCDNATVTNNTVIIYNPDETITQGIYIVGSNCNITNNNVTAIGPGIDIDWTGGDRMGLANTIAILNFGGNNNRIEGNVVKTSINDADITYYSTIEGIDIKQSSNVTVHDNIVEVSDARFVYAINALDDVHNVNITNNTLYSYSTRYTDGIQLGNTADNIIVANNIIYAVCYNDTIFTDDNEAMSFGIITTTMGGFGSTNNICVENNTILLNSTITYGIEVYTTSNSTVNNNTIINNGNYSMGMSLAHSENITVTNNNITTYGDSTVYINEIVEEIRPANTGIQIQQSSSNAYVVGNTVLTYDVGDNAISISVNATKNATVINNTLLANDLLGDNATNQVGDTEGTVISDNIAPVIKSNANIALSVPTSIDTGSSAIITIVVSDAETNELLNGQLVLKLNGKTLTDAEGNPVKIKVVDGVASYTYTFTGYSAKDYTLSAVFGNDSYNRAENTSTITVNKVEVVVNDFDTFEAYCGETIVLNKTFYDVNGVQLSGVTKVAIKINGKTVTNELRIVDGVLTGNFTIPNGLHEGANNITIILGENGRYYQYNMTIEFTVQKQDVVITIEPITAKSGEYITLKATIVGSETNTAITGGNYGFKINGKTVTDVDEYGSGSLTVQTLTDGTAIIHTYVEIFMDDGLYNVTVTYSGNSYTNSAKETSVALTVKT